jgi:hypothetical protein
LVFELRIKITLSTSKVMDDNRLTLGAVEIVHEVVGRRCQANWSSVRMMLLAMLMTPVIS